MPLPGFVSTDGGLAHTRFRAPVLSGTLSEGTSSGPGPVPVVGGFIPVQPFNAVTTASLNVALNQVLSTAAANIARASFVYIPQTTGAIATSSFAGGDSAPQYTSVGAALIWDASNQRLGIYSTAGGSGTWFFTNLQEIGTSAGAVIGTVVTPVSTAIGTANVTVSTAMVRNLFTSS